MRPSRFRWVAEMIPSLICRAIREPDRAIIALTITGTNGPLIEPADEILPAQDIGIRSRVIDVLREDIPAT